MSHGDAVAHGDGGELHRGASGGTDAGLHRLGDLIQVHVAGDDLVVGTDHADERPLQLLLGIAQGIEQERWGAANPFLMTSLRMGIDLLLNPDSSCLISLCIV